MSRRLGSPPALPGFEYVEPLGTGGFADVFKYTQLGLGRQVAVKVLLADLDPGMQASFEIEASVMAQLSNHPSIVSIYQAGVTDDGRPFLVMENCPPPHLAHRVRAKPLTVTKALEVVVQLCGAVETAHRLGVLHRDIKPANILFTQFGRAALTDFGISSTTASAESGQGVGMSVPWAPPEQLAVGAPMGPTGDVYALAATLWTCLVGRSPFHVQGGANDAVAMAGRVRTAPPPPTRRADVPESLERALRLAMAKSPTDRFESALSFARALQGIQAELHLPVTTIDVLDEQVAEAEVADDSGGTRVSGFVSIDPDEAPRTSTGFLPGFTASSVPPGPTASTPASTWSTQAPASPATYEGVDATVRPATASAEGSATQTPAEPAASVPDVAESGGRSPIALVVVGAVVLAVVAVGIWLGTRSSDGTEKETAPRTKPSAVNPISEAVPAPTDVKVKYTATALKVSWTSPGAEDGDVYLVLPQARPDRLNTDPEAAKTYPTSPITVPTKGERCVTVMVQRGRSYSDATLSCDQVSS